MNDLRRVARALEFIAIWLMCLVLNTCSLPSHEQMRLLIEGLTK